MRSGKVCECALKCYEPYRVGLKRLSFDLLASRVLESIHSHFTEGEVNGTTNKRFALVKQINSRVLRISGELEILYFPPNASDCS